jgi:hypothetical protein
VLLLLAIAFGGFGMLLAILLPVFRMGITPLLLAGTNVGRVCGVSTDSLALIVAASLALAVRLTTDALSGAIDRGLEILLAVTATPVRPHARLLFSSDMRWENFQAEQIARSANIEIYRVLTASLPAGLEGRI